MSKNPSPIVLVIHLETPEALADFLYHNDDEIIQSIHFDKEKPKPIFQFPASLDHRETLSCDLS